MEIGPGDSDAPLKVDRLNYKTLLPERGAYQDPELIRWSSGRWGRGSGGGCFFWTFAGKESGWVV